MKRRSLVLKTDLHREYDYLKEPTANEVIDSLVAYLQYDDTLPYSVWKDYVPEKSRMNEILKGWVDTSESEDSPWTVGSVAARGRGGIPDDATGQLLEMFRWTFEQPYQAPLSVRTARYISKLRWNWRCGGSDNGVIENKESCYMIAMAYSAREREVEASGDKRGMRSQALDAKIVLDKDVWVFAEALDLNVARAFYNDEDIDLDAELAKVAPEVANYARGVRANSAGVQKALEKPINDLTSVLGEFDPDDQARAAQLVNLSVKKLRENPVFRDASGAEAVPIMMEVATSLYNKYQQEGRQLKPWRPPLDEIVTKHLGEPG